MSLQDRIMEDLKDSMRRRDEIRVSVIRLLRASIKNAEVEKLRPLDDAEVLRVVEKEAKQRRESIYEFARGNRPDLVAREEAELAILLEYLPQQMSQDEVEAAARRVIAEVGATGPGDIGKVMPRLMAEVRGKADGRLVSQVVQGLLGTK
ncbi:MAG: GatB/YqeY domain-containing protein [Chloroflexi bacterium]|nr:GatB/YqeY domain-containing protein [Chloroflexota bacterium]